ncbi:MAG: hypothetical protein ACFCUQ_09790 [Kiloniellales bacterium]
MRIILGILLLCVALLVLDAPMTRGATDWVKAQVAAWFSDEAPKDKVPERAAVKVSGLAAGPVVDGCHRAEPKTCDIRKRRSCGPITLEFSEAADGASRCERAAMLLPPAQVIPLLRQVRCLLVGTDTRIRFTAENYVPQQGPRNGDTIEVRNGSGDLIVYGHYERADDHSRVTFENIGPGGSVVLKCEAFGPA